MQKLKLENCVFSEKQTKLIAKILNILETALRKNGYTAEITIKKSPGTISGVGAR